MKSNKRGVTLVALVITIIVLLILAGITISLTLGEDGIIKRAQEAGKNYTNAAEYEKQLLGNLTDDMESVIGNGTTGGSVQRRDFTISIPYVGTSSVTIKVDSSSIQDNIKKYVYMVGEEILETTQTEVTIENLPADSNLDVLVIALTDTNKYLINMQTVKTEARTYLYNNGDQCTSITGGWKAEAKGPNSKVSSVIPTLTFNEDCMKIYVNSTSGYHGGSVLINNTIDYSQYKKIHVTYTATLGKYSSATCININTCSEGQLYETHLCYQNAITTKTTKSFDISGIDEFYFYLQSEIASGAATCNIYEVWLEK